MPAARILLVDADTDATSQILNILAGVGYTVTTIADAEDALTHIGEHQLVIVDVVEGKKSAAELTAEIRGTPALARIPVLCVSQTDEVEERIGFLEAGADDVVAKPVDARELEARIEALLLRFQRSRDVTTPATPGDGVVMNAPRRIVTVFSPKGGVGTTMIATNIALVAAGQRPDRVVLLDLDLQFGGVAPQLDIEPKQTLSDVVRDASALKASEMLARVRRQARHGAACAVRPTDAGARRARHPGRGQEHPRDADQWLRPRDRRCRIGARRAHDACPRVG